MRGVTARFVMLIATAAVAPLVVYGVVSIKQLQSGTERSVTEGNRQVATQAAEQIKQYIENNQRVLRSLGAELRAPELQDWQRSRMLRDYVLFTIHKDWPAHRCWIAMARCSRRAVSARRRRRFLRQPT